MNNPGIISTPRERPILFSDPMVRAILRSDFGDWWLSKKTVTRRIIRDQDSIREIDGKVQWWTGFMGWAPVDTSAPPLKSLVGYGVPGDRLWVREAWRTHERESDAVDGILFRADEAFVEIEPTRAAADRWIDAHANGKHGESWRPAMYLPRWASRITLEITGVKIERLQDITELEAIHEGIDGPGPGVVLEGPRARMPGYTAQLPACGLGTFPTAREAFRVAWDIINRDRGPWESNPWVRAVSFRRIRP